MILAIEDLPNYIKKHASYYRGGIKIIFPYGYLITDEDTREMKKAKKWVKEHNGFWTGIFWFIPNSPK